MLAGIACSSAARHVFTSPTVAFRGVALDGIGPFGGRVRVALLVRNPNPYSLSTRSMQYQLFVRDSVPVASGQDTTHRAIAGHDSAVVTLPLDVSWRGLSTAATAVASYGLVSYRLVGNIVAGTPIGDRRIPFDQRGDFAPVRPR
ncbi:MAG TPA: LEA type 2 family protein [Gemmatimonadaceae bacterium]|nr:LEA type 2 family protein [Gemmatimonadaceae bacterium]